MLDIPSEVLHDILSRLPADTLLRFRCVSKAWRDTIDDSMFVRSHLHRQIHSSSALQLILRGELCSLLYSLSINSLNCEIIKAMPMNNPFLGGARSPVGSCNGVVLISDLKGYQFLWNPNTREVHRLPPPPKVMSKKSPGLYLSKCGLGFDCAADDYNVVKVAQVFDPRSRILNSETFLYSLKLNSWRRTEVFPYRISRLSGAFFVNNVLHWIASTTPLKCMDDLIIGLHLGTEDYCMIPLPSQLSGEMKTKPSGKILGVLGECMILSCYYQIECLDVWLMKDYGVKSSWIKLFSIGALDCIGAVETLRPLAYSKCKRQVLLQHDKNELLWFNLETKMVKKMKIDRGPNIFSSQICLGSLVRLNFKNAKRPSRGKIN